jgi:hypothetical protein
MDNQNKRQKKVDNDPLAGFASLTSAVIDSSSIIYLSKSSFLHLATRHIRLHTPLIVLKETGIDEPFFEIHDPETDSAMLTADKQVVELARKLNLPVISEDKKVLKNASGAGLSYYNALMILNFLLYKKEVTIDNYQKHYTTLISVARYSKFVIGYGEMVTKKILGIA